MTAAAIQRMRAAGFTLKAKGDRLTVEGPKPLTNEQRHYVKAHKSELLVAVKFQQATMHPTVKAALDTFPGAEIVDIRDRWEERAAIIEEGCGVSREIAEVLADQDLLDNPRNPGVWK